MKHSRALSPVRSGASILFLFLILLQSSSFRAAAWLDVNGDGLDDIWQLKYNASGLSANAITNGDGMTNAQKSIAGVNPFAPNSALRVSSIKRDSSGVHLTWS